jgi:UDP-N-acetyl-D-mannosaminuronic acid dehydrogenase
MFAAAGFPVVGADVDDSKVKGLRSAKADETELGLRESLLECLKKGNLSFEGDVAGCVRASDIVSLCVNTPIEKGVPNMKNLHVALGDLKSALHKEMLILIQTTIPPSTTDSIASEFERIGYKIDEDLFLAHCPERLAPTRALEEILGNTRIVGGVGPKSTEIASQLFGTVCRDVVATDALTAELSKLAENTFRDLNIAYANFLAQIAERVGADVSEVIKIANTHPRVNIHIPGLGVGGPCLPKDPYMLLKAAPPSSAQLVRLAREINDGMSRDAVNRIVHALIAKGVPVKNAKIAVLGVAYKPDTEDTTNSPAKSIIQDFIDRGANVSVYDPYSSEAFGGEKTSLEEALVEADCVVIATAHTSFKSIDLNKMAEVAGKGCMIFDGPRLLDPRAVRARGLRYLGTGYGRDERGSSDS